MKNQTTYKVALFGATGKTGSIILHKLLKEKTHVNILVRNRDSVSELKNNDLVKIIQGDIRDYSSIRDTLSSCDRVISVIGHNKNSQSNMQSIGIKNTIAAMIEIGITKIVVLTGTGVRVKGDRIPFYDKLGNYIIKKVDPERISDGIEYSRILQESGLDWTILRVLKLSSSDTLYKFENMFTRPILREFGPAQLVISRNTVADKIIEIINTDKWIGKNPIL
jgi:nucleoside-diphosphate-sugar epimerase